MDQKSWRGKLTPILHCWVLQLYRAFSHPILFASYSHSLKSGGECVVILLCSKGLSRKHSLLCILDQERTVGKVIHWGGCWRTAAGVVVRQEGDTQGQSTQWTYMTEEGGTLGCWRAACLLRYALRQVGGPALTAPGHRHRRWRSCWGLFLCARPCLALCLRGGDSILWSGVPWLLG